MRILNDLLNLCFPRMCPACGEKLIEGEECLCLECLMTLPRTGFEHYPHSYMEKLHWGRLPVVRSGAFFYYNDERVRNLLHALKYNMKPEVGRYVARTFAKEIENSGFFEGIDAIVPVPLHFVKKMQRGYNQSEYLARGLSDVTGVPVWADVVRRRVYTNTQTHKNRVEREENVRDIFECVNPKKISGKHILLVDDVFTTGSTIGECVSSISDAVNGKNDGIVLVEESKVKVSILAVAYAGQHRLV